MKEESEETSISYKLLLTPVLLTLVTAVILWLSGRRLWCEGGEFFLWAGDIWSRHTSQHLFDPYTFSHILHGVIFFWFFRWVLKSSSLPALLNASVALECAWEILENSPIIINRYREATIALDYFGDSVLNSVADVVSCVLGFFVARAFRFSVSVFFFLFTEVILLFSIRDNLTLNVLMLICPIDAVKQWQMP